MVSGFLTSPCDHCRMSSAVARPMRSSSKKLTSSTLFQSLSFRKVRQWSWSAWRLRRVAVRCRPPACRATSSDLFDAARLAPRQVNAEFLRGAEDVLVGFPHLDGHAVT